MRKRTPDELQKEEVSRLVQEFLGDDYKEMVVTTVTTFENLLEETTRVQCDLRFGDQALAIDSTGAGIVDALFEGMKAQLQGQYLSLSQIDFEDFFVDTDPCTRVKKSGTDIAVRVSICTVSSNKRRHHFATESRSFSIAAIKSVISAVEYYLNCERAVLLLRETIDGARRSGRPDLIQKYVALLAEIVRNTSYEKSLREWNQKN